MTPNFAPASRWQRATNWNANSQNISKNSGEIHGREPEFHNGVYQELLLTNRQYAFARKADHSIAITAGNSDDAPANLSVPVPIHASEAKNLMDGTIIPITNGRLNLTLPGNSGVVLKITEE